MPYVGISARDGEFDVEPMTDESADRFMQQGGDVIYVEDDVYEAWVAHMKQHRAFNALWRSVTNEQAQRQRLREVEDERNRLRGIVDLVKKTAQPTQTRKGVKK